jgi:hypothetical protein
MAYADILCPAGEWTEVSGVGGIQNKPGAGIDVMATSGSAPTSTAGSLVLRTGSAATPDQVAAYFADVASASALFVMPQITGYVGVTDGA